VQGRPAEKCALEHKAVEKKCRASRLEGVEAHEDLLSSARETNEEAETCQEGEKGSEVYRSQNGLRCSESSKALSRDQVPHQFFHQTVTLGDGRGRRETDAMQRAQRSWWE